MVQSVGNDCLNLISRSVCSLGRRDLLGKRARLGIVKDNPLTERVARRAGFPALCTRMCILANQRRQFGRCPEGVARGENFAVKFRSENKPLSELREVALRSGVTRQKHRHQACGRGCYTRGNRERSATEGGGERRPNCTPG